MSRETIYLVQAFKAGKGTRLTAHPPIRCKSSDGARRTARRLALTKAGVVVSAYGFSYQTETRPSVLYAPCDLQKVAGASGQAIQARDGRHADGRVNVPTGVARLAPLTLTTLAARCALERDSGGRRIG